jgi:UDP-N-acetylglucosamine--N-acetylmuramyl-(pentapeptide) pyrophosphoryl-undecaprenol N-acetylglucosamine transferase
VVFAGGGTGGHLFPALAIARALMSLAPELRPLFVGARRGVERDVLPTTEFPHELLDLHPLYRSRPWQNWKTLAGMTRGWSRISSLLRGDRPRLVVATGGYASSAMLAWATAKRVPFVLQEQNSFAGKTIQLFSRYARAVYLGFPEAQASLPAPARARAIETGNPIEPPPDPRPDRGALRREWGFARADSRVLLAFGGSQGSAALNALIDALVARGLPDGLDVIWGTGRDHYERHAHRASARVVIRPFLSPIAKAYAVADLALVRSGAMTTAELCAWGVPMLLVPLPTAAADHQTANAKALAAAVAARWIAQREATLERLDAELAQLLSSPDALARLAQAARARARPRAALDIATRILALLDARAA